MRLYDYVGDPAIRERALRAPPGSAIVSIEDLAAWHIENPDAFEEGCTFVVSAEGALLLAPRRSEHVACAGGQAVLAAGEIRFAEAAAADGAAGFKIAYASNHSTGYCPEPSCYEALAAALERLGVAHAGRFHRGYHFRRCKGCGQINLVKDDWWSCAVCGEGLPAEWNFGTGQGSRHAPGR